jgi:hypothetical protein
LDFKILSRYQHITNRQFHEIVSAESIQERNLVATKYGLRNITPILSQLIWDRHLQTPQDIYHATAGKIMRLLKLTVNLFLPEGQKEFIKTWKIFEYPAHWGHLPNPISHHESFMMSDYLRLAMVIPFILNRSLKTWHIKSAELTNIQQRINANRTDLVSKSLTKCWVLVAKSAQLVFKKSYSIDDYENLQKCLDTESRILTQVSIIYLYYDTYIIYNKPVNKFFLLGFC